MNNILVKRLKNEEKILEKCEDESIFLKRLNSNNFVGFIKGPYDSYYKDMTFIIQV